MKKQNKTISSIILFSNTFMLLILVYILYNSLKYWVANFDPRFEITLLSYYITIAVVIVSVLGRWIEGRIKAIIRDLNRFGGENGGERKT